MSIAGTFPEQGFRIRLERVELRDDGGARYEGHALVPEARLAVGLVITGEGAVTLALGAPEAPDGSSVEVTLASGDEAFVRQLGKQLHRQAREAPIDQGGGQWARRVQRWRGPK